VAHLDAGGLHKQRGRQMQRAVETRRRKDDAVGALLGVGDQFLQILVGLLVVDHQHHRTFGETRNRDKVGAREFGLAPEQLVDGCKAGNRRQVGDQGITIRLCTGSELRAHGSCSPGFGFDHQRLLQQRLHNGPKRTSDNIDGATRREWIDQRHRPRRIYVLSSRRSGGKRCSGGSRADDETAPVDGTFIHGFLRESDRPLRGLLYVCGDAIGGAGTGQPRITCNSAAFRHNS
jgi:hypothetical protein